MSPAAKKEDQGDAVVRRLDAIIALLIRSTNQPSMSDQIRALDDMGFDPAEIAQIIGRDTGYVTTIRARNGTRSKARKQQGASKKTKGR